MVWIKILMLFYKQARISSQTKEQDDGTGLYNYDARLYDPVIGQFIMADTIVPDLYNPQSLNRYAYCLNNPVRYVDPSGHYPGTLDGSDSYAGHATDDAGDGSTNSGFGGGGSGAGTDGPGGNDVYELGEIVVTAEAPDPFEGYKAPDPFEGYNDGHNDSYFKQAPIGIETAIKNRIWPNVRGSFEAKFWNDYGKFLQGPELDELNPFNTATTRFNLLMEYGFYTSVGVIGTWGLAEEFVVAYYSSAYQVNGFISGYLKYYSTPNTRSAVLGAFTAIFGPDPKLWD